MRTSCQTHTKCSSICSSRTAEPYARCGYNSQHPHHSCSSRSKAGKRTTQLSKSRRVLVTGGAGFVGSHLVDRLVELGHPVTVLDNFTTGSDRNLAGHHDKAAVRIVRGTVLDADLVDTLVAQHPLTFHLAAAVGVG